MRSNGLIAIKLIDTQMLIIASSDVILISRNDPKRSLLGPFLIFRYTKMSLPECSILLYQCYLQFIIYYYKSIFLELATAVDIKRSKIMKCLNATLISNFYYL